MKSWSPPAARFLRSTVNWRSWRTSLGVLDGHARLAAPVVASVVGRKIGALDDLADVCQRLRLGGNSRREAQREAQRGERCKHEAFHFRSSCLKRPVLRTGLG
jgi:hypothetical protein